MADTNKRPGPIRSGLMFVVFQLVTLIPVLYGIGAIRRGVPGPFDGERQLPPEIEAAIMERYAQPTLLEYLRDNIGALLGNFPYPGLILWACLIAAVAAWMLWKNGGGLRGTWLALTSYMVFILSGVTWVLISFYVLGIRTGLPWVVMVLALSVLTFVLFYRKNIWAAATLIPAVLVTLLLTDRVLWFIWISNHGF